TINNSIDLAIKGDEFGYHRIWYAEHHSMNFLVSSAPELIASHALGKTKQIRIGSGGIMLMHYSPLKMAEQASINSLLSKGRYDFGVGRAPGGDYNVINALANTNDPSYNDQYQQLEDTLKLIAHQPATNPLFKNVVATPDASQNLPEAWLLGSTGNSALKAGELGLRYGFAQFFMGALSKEIITSYKQAFKPSVFTSKPYVSVAYQVVVGDTYEQAFYLAAPLLLISIRMRLGLPMNQVSNDEAYQIVTKMQGQEKAVLNQLLKIIIIGDAKTVANNLLSQQQEYGFDEAMLVIIVEKHEDRIKGYQQLAQQLIK
ncbi:MAG: MsnO8 family LLM class oxidoreductase, partial [Bacilli bacterium]